MKPITDEEISQFKVWAEKMRERYPADLHYQDILRLIEKIDFLRSPAANVGKVLIEAFLQGMGMTAGGIVGGGMMKSAFKGALENATETERKACEEIADRVRREHLAKYIGSNCPYHTVAEEIMYLIRDRAQKPDQDEPEEKEEVSE